ncbi:hypothetical protein [Microvirga flavescens]|uniref:hypothetical protein n=1 Tax=Microvirga flavescens TaxID=2249811 RepID=UPI000DDAC784|nr:hypothetical protein [Microvirga flavescens]
MNRRLVGLIAALALGPLSLAACATPTEGGRLALIRILREQVSRCYVPLVQARGAESAKIEMRLNPDGSLAGPPKVLSTPADSAAARAAVRAVERCAPFKIPAAFANHYSTWKVVQIIFDLS